MGVVRGVSRRHRANTRLKWNRAKTEGLRLGKTKRSYSTHESVEGIQWVTQGGWIRILGFPIGEDYDPIDFLKARYLKLKRLLVTWAHTG